MYGQVKVRMVVLVSGPENLARPKFFTLATISCGAEEAGVVWNKWKEEHKELCGQTGGLIAIDAEFTARENLGGA